jgi:hypothetical protein
MTAPFGPASASALVRYGELGSSSGLLTWSEAASSRKIAVISPVEYRNAGWKGPSRQMHEYRTLVRVCVEHSRQCANGKNPSFEPTTERVCC